MSRNVYFHGRTAVLAVMGKLETPAPLTLLRVGNGVRMKWMTLEFMNLVVVHMGFVGDHAKFPQVHKCISFLP